MGRGAEGEARGRGGRAPGMALTLSAPTVPAHKLFILYLLRVIMQPYDSTHSPHPSSPPYHSVPAHTRLLIYFLVLIVYPHTLTTCSTSSRLIVYPAHIRRIFRHGVP